MEITRLSQGMERDAAHMDAQERAARNNSIPYAAAAFACLKAHEDEHGPIPQRAELEKALATALKAAAQRQLAQ